MINEKIGRGHEKKNIRKESNFKLTFDKAFAELLPKLMKSAGFPFNFSIIDKVCSLKTAEILI